MNTVDFFGHQVSKLIVGDNLNYIFQPYMPMDQEVNVRQMLSINGTIGVYHQGTTTDFLYESGLGNWVLNMG